MKNGAMNLEVSKKEFMEGLGGRKGRENDIIAL